MEVVIDDRPEIVVFKSDSVLVGEKLSYTITWKTINATDVNITFFAKVETSICYCHTHQRQLLFSRGYPFVLTDNQC